MKRILLIVPVIMILLSACGAPTAMPAPAAVETNFPPTLANTEAAPTSTDMPTDAPTDALPDVPPPPAGMKLPAPSFESQTYIDEKSGFAFDYPNGWTVNEAMAGERASQVQFLSSPDLANAATLPEGATRLSATVYNWDPKNDLAAYTAHWKSIWSDPGFKILDEEELVLEQGLPAVQFTVQSPGTTTIFLITTLRDRYLVISGEGNLDLVKEIVQRVRPISVK